MWRRWGLWICSSCQWSVSQVVGKSFLCQCWLWCSCCHALPQGDGILHWPCLWWTFCLKDEPLRCTWCVHVRFQQIRYLVHGERMRSGPGCQKVFAVHEVWVASSGCATVLLWVKVICGPSVESSMQTVGWAKGQRISTLLIFLFILLLLFGRSGCN